jgi:magnesium transporter
MATTLLAVNELEDRVRERLKRPEELRPLLSGRRAADIANLLDRLPPDARLAVFEALDPAIRPRVLHEASADATRTVLGSIPAEQAGRLLDRLPMDEAARVLTEDVPERSEELLGEMSEADAAEVRQLLAYPPRSAGRLMTEKFPVVAAEQTAGEALARLRSPDAEWETLTDLYSLDDAGRLRGVVSLRELVLADPATPVAELLTTDVVAVAPEADQEEVARLVSRYDFLALPVVGGDGRMLGLVGRRHGPGHLPPGCQGAVSSLMFSCGRGARGPSRSSGPPRASGG